MTPKLCSDHGSSNVAGAKAWSCQMCFCTLLVRSCSSGFEISSFLFLSAIALPTVFLQRQYSYFATAIIEIRCKKGQNALGCEGLWASLCCNVINPISFVNWTLTQRRWWCAIHEAISNYNWFFVNSPKSVLNWCMVQSAVNNVCSEWWCIFSIFVAVDVDG